MKPQTPPSPNRGPDAFVQVTDQALGELLRYKKTYKHAFDIGIRPKELLAYAKGELDSETRREVTSLISRSPWAMSRVVALVKSWREGPVQLTLPDDDLEGLKLLDTVKGLRL
jgi:hypothetical protein